MSLKQDLIEDTVWDMTIGAGQDMSEAECLTKLEDRLGHSLTPQQKQIARRKYQECLQAVEQP